MELLGKMSLGKGHLVTNMGFGAKIGLFTGKSQKNPFYVKIIRENNSKIIENLMEYKFFYHYYI